MKNIIHKILALSALLIPLTFTGKPALAIDEDVLYLAATLYGEARGESDAGLTVVANTIMNRYEFYSKKVKTGMVVRVKDVCLADKQYSFWNNKKSWSASQIISYTQKESNAWTRCLQFAQKAISGNLADITGGAMNYYASSGRNTISTPAWARGLSETQIGHHSVVRGVSMGSLKVNGVILAGGGKSDGTSYTGGNASSGVNVDADSGGGSSDVLTNGDSPVSFTSNHSGCSSSVKTFSTTPDGSGAVIDPKVLVALDKMMEKIYTSLGKTFMLGHALICYGTEVEYYSVPTGMLPPFFLKIPNFSFCICGLLIYGTAFFLTMAIGMYFLDISYKLGFAVLFLPVSMALWPFPPTKNKFTDNISIVLRNAMLFTFVSVGICYAVILINRGVLSNMGWKDFWEAIEKDSTEKLSENFDLVSLHILVMIFALIYGFKIVGSSINDYLGRFFSDGVFGSSSPMHQMGTQAVGTLANWTVKPALSYAQDVATATAGRGMAAVGRSMNRMANGDFSDIKKAAKGVKYVGNKLANPRQTYNQVMYKAGEVADKAIQKAGSGLNKVVGATGKAAVDVYDKYQGLKDAVASAPDNMSQLGGSGSNPNPVSQAEINQLRAARDVARAARMAKFTAQTENLVKMTQGNIAEGAAIVGNVANNVLAHGGGVAAQLGGLATSSVIAAGINKVRSGKKPKVTGEQVMAAVAALPKDVENWTKDKIAAGTAKAINSVAKGKPATQEGTRLVMHNIKENIKRMPNSVAKATVQAALITNAYANQAPVSLSPSQTLKAVKNSIVHPEQTGRLIKKMASSGLETLRPLDGKERTKLILNKSGQIVVRSVRDTAKDAGKLTLKVAGGFFEHIGTSMADNRKKKRSIKSWSDMTAEAEAKKEALEEERLRNTTIE